MKKSIEVLENLHGHITTAANGDVIMSMELAQALKDATDAMEKQIPRRVDRNVASADIRIGAAIFGKGTTTYKCRCGRLVLRSSSYCPDCGQKLDWGKERWT